MNVNYLCTLNNMCKERIYTLTCRYVIELYKRECEGEMRGLPDQHEQAWIRSQPGGRDESLCASMASVRVLSFVWIIG